MNTSPTTVPVVETFNPETYRRLDVNVGGFTVEVEAPDGLVITCAPWSPTNRVGTQLGVEDYLYTVTQRLSAQRRVGPFGGTVARTATADEVHVARRAVDALLRALDASAITEGSYRMILRPEVTARIHPREWRFVPSFVFFSQAADAITAGQLAADDVQSFGPETDLVRELRASGALLAFGTTVHGGDRGHTFLCRRPNGQIAVVYGAAQAHEFLESLG